MTIYSRGVNQSVFWGDSLATPLQVKIYLPVYLQFSLSSLVSLDWIECGLLVPWHPSNIRRTKKHLEARKHRVRNPT